MRRKCFAFLLALAMCLGLAAPAFAAAEDFVIENGELVKYNGPGGDVAIPDGVTKIGDKAFGFPGDQRHVTGVTIPDSVTEIGEYAFAFCADLTEIVIPNSVTIIGGSAFSDCSALTSVTLPNGITKIESDAFSKCAVLTDISIPDGVTEIGYGAFYHCAGLTAITIPNSTVKIDSFAFAGCTALTELVIPDGLTEIGWSAFYGCTSLTSLSIPASVTAVGPSAFSDTPWLEQQGEFPTVNGILLVYQGKGGNVVIPGGITKIEHYAFSGCELLTSVTIPEGVMEIGYMAFSDCPGLTGVTLPASVTEIGQWAFQSVDAPPAGYAPDIWLPDGLVLLAPAGSYAETYAQENDIPFTALIHGFTDLRPDGFYVDAVGWAVANNITTGKTAATFAPDENCTHGQILTFLWRAAGKPASSAQAPIALIGDEYYAGAVRWAAEKGMIGADFNPNAPCNRAYAVLYIWQAMGKPAPTKASPFTDVPAHWSSAQAAAWAAEKGITTGTTATTFNPSGICTRGQIVTFLYRAYK